MDLDLVTKMEKDTKTSDSAIRSIDVDDTAVGDGTVIKPSWSYRLYLAVQKLDRYGLESRGIQRVPSDERQPATVSTWLGLCLIWYA